MRKIFTLLVLFFIVSKYTTAQTVTSTYVNWRDMVAYEAAHPELFKTCETCPKKISDNWEAIVNPNMPFPPGANIKTNGIYRDNILPDAPSRAPIQSWWGHTDPGSLIPPDTHGAVGLNHVITATNNYIKIHAKVGGAQISQVSLSTFTTGANTDPYMLFDPSTQRWMLSAIQGSNNNFMCLMVSNTSDPTGTWRRITWIPTGGPMLLDHPYLGFDGLKIVVSGRRFQGGTTLVGPSLFLIDKADMLAGNPITFGTNAQQIDKTNADGDCPLPVTVYDPPFSNTGNPSPGTFYVLQAWSGASSSIRLTTVTGTIPTATWNSATAVFPSGGTPWNNGALGNAAEQVTETRRLAANDARISCGIMMNGKLWCTQHIGFPASGTPDRIAVQWWELDGTPGGNFGNVIQRGRVGGNNPNEYKWFSGITVNRDEDVLIGYSASDLTTHVNAAYVTRQATTPLNTTDDEYVFKTGIDRYWKDFGSGRARWGDYSHCSLDPVDNSLWAIQQYAELGAGPIPPDNNSRYGVWWAQVAPSVPPSGFLFDSPGPVTSPCPAGASMNITLRTISVGGFTNPVTLSAAGNPGGTTVNFSSNPVIPGASPGTPVTVTLNNTSTLSAGTYSVTVTGIASGAPNQTRDLTFTITAGAGPTITTHPFPQTVCAGGNVTFSVAAIGSGLTYQWQLSTNGGASYSNIGGATGTSYTINGALASQNNYMYRCIVSIQCGSSTSNAATLTVNTPPAISTQPQSATLCTGSNNTFSVTATGSGLTYQWQLSTNGGGTFNDIAGATSSSYTVSGVTTGMSNYQYRVVVSGTCPSPVTSSAAVLTVISPVTVTTQPSAATVCDPGNTSFTVAGSGSGVIYQWQLSTDGGANYSNIANGGVYTGATSATLSLTGVSVVMNNYRYRCLLSNATCTTPAISTAVVLTVNTVPALSSQPQDVTLCSGSNNTFTVTATGSGLTYQWQLSTDGGTSFNNIIGATSSSYTVSGTTVGMNNNRYRCVVSGACTPPAVSNAVVLNVIAPVGILTQPVNSELCSGGNTGFSVAATSTQTIIYQWQISTDGGTTWTNISGATSSALPLAAVVASMNNNRYRCQLSSATCEAPTISTAALLNVRQTPTVGLSAAPLTSLLPGQLSTLTATPSPATGGTLTTSWFYNSNPLTVIGNTYVANVEKIGAYQVRIQESWPSSLVCSNQSAIITLDATISNKLFIFPSPNNGTFTVSYYNAGGASSSRTVTVFDSKGSKVYNAKFPVVGPYTLLSIDVQPAQTGIYYVLVGDATGKKLAEGKVLVH